jgi:hypothetical protein
MGCSPRRFRCRFPPCLAFGCAPLRRIALGLPLIGGRPASPETVQHPVEKKDGHDRHEQIFHNVSSLLCSLNRHHRRTARNGVMCPWAASHAYQCTSSNTNVVLATASRETPVHTNGNATLRCEVVPRRTVNALSRISTATPAKTSAIQKTFESCGGSRSICNTTT